MPKTLSITTAAVLFALSTLAVAQSSSSPSSTPSSSSSAGGSSSLPSSTSTPNFSAADTNNDGQVSRAEWDAYFSKSGSSTSGSMGGSGSSTTK